MRSRLSDKRTYEVVTLFLWAVGLALSPQHWLGLLALAVLVLALIELLVPDVAESGYGLFFDEFDHTQSGDESAVLSEDSRS